jgi:hypothetical protein
MAFRITTYLATTAILLIILIQGCPSDVQETESVSESGNIIVTEPDRGEKVRSPVKVEGRARVFEAALTVRILDQDGKELAIRHIMASEGGPAFGTFSARVIYQRPRGMRRGTVQVLSYSAKDGSPINVVDVPVEFGD